MEEAAPVGGIGGGVCAGEYAGLVPRHSNQGCFEEIWRHQAALEFAAQAQGLLPG